MKILLSSRGSRGDVYPILAIAQELKNQGHHITLCVPELFRDLAEECSHQCFYSGEDMEDAMRNMKNSWRGAQKALDWFVHSMDEQFELYAEAGKGIDLMVTSINEMAAPSMAEYFNIPHYRVAYAPIIPGTQPPPLQPFQNMPSFMNRLFWKGLNASVQLFKGHINKKRRILGLAPISSVSDYLAKTHTIHAINRMLAPASASWKYPYSYAGYCFFQDTGALDSELESFLKEGPPPVYIGFGSVHVPDPQAFTRTVMSAIDKAGCRAVISSGWAGLGNTDNSDKVYFCGETPHAALFPLCSGIVHHGGSGTTHNAARAGVPQLIMPQIADQYYWGNRIYKLGLGPKPLVPKKATVEVMTTQLKKLDQDSFYLYNARSFARSFSAEDGVKTVISFIADQQKQHVNELHYVK